MKKLIAQRPIQYMGRIYESGEAIPAHDPQMVEAWLKAQSAAWTGIDMEDAACAIFAPGNYQDGGEMPAVPTGHLDPVQLERMKKEDLLDLAEKLGVDVSAAKNQRERAQLIAAEEVQALADPPENNGGTQ